MADPLEFDEEPRALRFDEPASSPVVVLLEQMRRHTREVDELLANVACEWFELQHAAGDAGAKDDPATANEWRAVEIVASRLEQWLAERHVSVDDPTGEQWRDEMRRDYDLIGFSKREDITVATVSHTLSPLVRRFDRVIRKGKVTVDAPAAKTPGEDSTGPSEEGE